MGKCPAWREDDQGLVSFSHDRCYATKEIEVCDCLGNEAFCNFYPEKRKAAAQPKFGEWISVEDRLPDTRHAMLVCTRNRNNVPKIAMAYFENGFGWCGSGGRWNNVTHWMPLPEPPKENEKDENA